MPANFVEVAVLIAVASKVATDKKGTVVTERPKDTTASQYDVIVIGAGSTGENVAARTAQGGLSTAIVEAELVGGSCSYWACMPSKALLRPAELLDQARQVSGTKQAVTGGLDVEAVLARRDSFTRKGDDSGQADWVRDAGIALLRGRGRLSGEHEITVTKTDGTTTMLRAKHAIAICTGSSPAIPDIEGLARAHPWTNKEATSAQRAPGKLLVLGGGAVGCELALAWQSLGSRVQLIHRGERVLSNYEPEVSRRVGDAMISHGVTVHTGIAAKQVSRERDGGVTVRLDDGRELSGDELLVAVGRTPNTDDIGLDVVGLDGGKKLHTDDTMRITAASGEWLYAAGDCTDRTALTHMGKYQARVCGDAIIARSRGTLGSQEPEAYSKYTATADHNAVPQVVFTIPQAAMVGLTQRQAEDRGIEVKAVEYEIGDTAGGSLHLDGYNGYAKLVVDSTREVIVGASFVGADVSELLHSATIAIVAEVPLSRLWHAVPSYPTISEVWLRLLETYGL